MSNRQYINGVQVHDCPQDKLKAQECVVVCRSCCRATYHRIAALTTVVMSWGSASSPQERDSYRIVVCKGCETVSFLYEPYHNEDTKNKKVFPTYLPGRESASDWPLCISMPDVLRDLYMETDTAMANQHYIMPKTTVTTSSVSIITGRRRFLKAPAARS